uniref:Uncharacterized protein n=1 Tax=Setaria viridis TaxID=4556 RepID=A0A4U6U1W2_SETVI|nr:hypothetical protein SEVIR_6G103532v2 [Setaria viridis]
MGRPKRPWGPDAMMLHRSPASLFHISSPLPKRLHGQKVAAAERQRAKKMLLAKVTMTAVSSCAAESSVCVLLHLFCARAWHGWVKVRRMLAAIAM